MWRGKYHFNAFETSLKTLVVGYPTTQKSKLMTQKSFLWETSFDVLMEWILHHHARSVEETKFFGQWQCSFLKEAKILHFCLTIEFFSKIVSNKFATVFCGACPQKKDWTTNSTLPLKNKPKNNRGEDKITCGEASRISKDFLDPLCRRNFQVWDEIGRNSFLVDWL